MQTKAWKMTAVAVVFAFWSTNLVPLRAATSGNYRNNISAGVVLQTDDDDDDMSGGALAVLLLAVGGAVAGNRFETSPNQVTTNSYTLDLVAGIAKVLVDDVDAAGKPQRSTWTAMLDRTSQTITLSKDGSDGAGKPARSRWAGKADGEYYRVASDPTAHEFSFAVLDPLTLSFSARKAGRVALTGRIAVSSDGRSFTISKEKISPSGRRLNRQLVYLALSSPR